MPLQLRLHDVEVRAAPRTRNADQPDAVQLQQTIQVVIAGILDEDRVARLQHVAHQKIERLACAVRNENLRSVRAQTQLRDTRLQAPPQAQAAERRSVV